MEILKINYAIYRIFWARGISQQRANGGGRCDFLKKSCSKICTINFY